MEFQELIIQLKGNSRDYHFCQDGKKHILTATNVMECIALLRENIVYCFNSEFHQVIAENIEIWYQHWKKEFNQCGIWVNENSEKQNGLILLTSRNVLNVVGKERCFVFGKRGVTVFAIDHAKVYSKNHYAHIILSGHSYGFIFDSYHVSVHGNATCYAEKSKIHSIDNCRLFLTEDCTWEVDVGHKEYEKIQHFAFQ